MTRVRLIFVLVASLLGLSQTASPFVSASSMSVKGPNLALYHNGWDTAYRDPFAAAPTDSQVTLRLRSATTVKKAWVYLSPSVGKAKAYPMSVASRHGKTLMWSATLTMPSTPDAMNYYFKVQAGKTVRWYGDNNRVGEDGAGQSYSKASKVLTYELTVYLKTFQAPDWMRNAVVYQIFPDRFYDGDTANDPVNGTKLGYITIHFHQDWNDLPDQPGCGCDFFGGDLQGIIDKLPYLHSLGVNVIYLNPIFLAPSNHKYDTSNFLQIDPEFGTLSTFQTLVSDMKALGMHLVLDGVFEDTGSDSVYFNQYGRFPDTGAYQSQSSPYYPWYTFQNWPNQYSDWSGVSTLPLLNENDAVKDFIFRKPNSVAQYWLQQGASGWRLDSADTLSHEYWQEFRTAIKSAYPDTVIIGEYWQNALQWLLGNQWDGVVNYQFREPLLDFFANGAGAQNPGKTNARGFLEDEMGLLSEYPAPAIESSMNIVDSHDTSRILTDLNGNKQALRLVALFQMTWPGAPTVYYGDEAGLQGQTDPDDRRTFPWDAQDTSLEQYYSDLIHLRLAHPALNGSPVYPLFAGTKNRVVAYLRQEGQESIVVALNDSTKAQTVKIPVPQLAEGAHLSDLLPGGTTSVSVSGGAITVTLQPLSGVVLG